MKHINIRARTPEGAIMRLLDILDPAEVATAVDLLIARLDAAAGDPDLEGDTSEDGFEFHPYDGPGCPIADPSDDKGEDCCAAGDDRIMSGPVVEDDTWWHARAAGKLIGDDDDVELNGDEGDYTEGPFWER